MENRMKGLERSMDSISGEYLEKPIYKQWYYTISMISILRRVYETYTWNIIYLFCFGYGYQQNIFNF
jgi:hypothetical protein